MERGRVMELATIFGAVAVRAVSLSKGWGARSSLTGVAQQGRGEDRGGSGRGEPEERVLQRRESSKH
jgi:hypothetical protein